MVLLCANMATSLSLRSLLDNDKLVGPNFGSWYWKLKIVLEHEWILYVIMDPAPEELLLMHVEQSETLTRSGSVTGPWCAVSCWLSWATSSVADSRRLSQRTCFKCWRMPLAHQMTWRGTRLVVPSSMPKCRMVPLSLIMYCIWSSWWSIWASSAFPCMSSLGKMQYWTRCPSLISHSSLIIEWQSLKYYHGLLGLLQNFEKDHQLHKESVNLVGDLSSSFRPFKKEKKNMKKKVKKVQVQAGTSVQGQTRKIKPDKSQTEYFFCKKWGHWKRNLKGGNRFSS